MSIIFLAGNLKMCASIVRKKFDVQVYHTASAFHYVHFCIGIPSQGFCHEDTEPPCSLKSGNCGLYAKNDLVLEV